LFNDFDITVSVSDRNDFAVTFDNGPYFFLVKANTGEGVQILDMEFSDQDSCAQVAISLVQGGDITEFSFDESTGILVTTAALVSSEVSGSFNFKVSGRDILTASPNPTVVDVTIAIANAGEGIFLTPENAYPIGESLRSVNNPNTFQQDLGFFAGVKPGTRFDVSSHFAQLTATSSVTVATQKAASVAGILVTQDFVYATDAKVRVALSVLDDNLNSVTQAASVVIKVILDTSASIVAKCTTSGGKCLATATLPSAWFNDINASTSISIFIGFEDGRTPLAGVGKPLLLRKQPSFVLSNDVLLVMPAHDLYRNDVVQIPVTANTGPAVEAFTLKLSSSPHLVITAVQLDTNQWTGETSTTSNGATVTAVVKDPASVPAGPVAVTQLLTVTVRVSASAPENAKQSLNCTIVFLKNVLDQAQIQPRGNNNPTSASFLNRNASALTGEVHVLPDALVGLIVQAGQGQLANTAVLDGKKIANPFTVTGVYRARGAFVALADHTCASLQTEILNVDAGCANAILNGSETSSGTATIAVSKGSIDSVLELNVWRPEIPISLTLTDVDLSPVAGWVSGAGCVQQYQSATVLAKATFAFGSTKSDVVDVSHVIKRSVVPDNSSIVKVDAATGVVSAVAVGSTVLRIAPATGLSSPGSTAIQVSATPLTVGRLASTVVRTFDVALVGNPGPTSGAKLATLSTYNSDFSFEFQTSQVVVKAVLSDGNDLQLSGVDGIDLSHISSAPTAIAVLDEGGSAGDLMALGSVINATITTTWISPCGGGSLGSSQALVSALLPVPTSVVLSNIAAKMAIPGSIPASLGLPVSVGFTVKLRFPDGRLQDMTNDPRTVYKTNATLELLPPASGQALLKTNASTVQGDVIVTVSFLHVNLTATLATTVVGVDRIEVAAHPYPTYGGSGQFSESILSKYEATNVYQSAVLAAFVFLDDGTTLDISRDAGTTVKLLARGQPTEVRCRCLMEPQLAPRPSASS